MKVGKELGVIENEPEDGIRELPIRKKQRQEEPKKKEDWEVSPQPA